MHNISEIRTQYDALRASDNNKDAQLKKLKLLIEQSEQSNTTEFIALRGAMVAYEASLQGGLHGLTLAKKARLLLENSIQQKENVLDGYALLCLGALYYRVPAWPIGFRDKNKAEQLFLKAMQLNPQQLDPYVFYAEFLEEKHAYKEAMQQVKKGLELPPPSDRIPAYQARKHEARALLKKLELHMGLTQKS